MSEFTQMVRRGGAVMREWYCHDGITRGVHTLLAGLAANLLSNVFGKQYPAWNKQERKDNANIIRIALVSAYQMGRASRC